MTISVIRTVILYLLIMAAMRLMGKRQLGELQPSELVVTLLLSDLAAVPMQENGLPLLNGVLPILVLVSLELLISGAMLKSPLITKWVSGSPVPIIRDGVPDVEALRRLRMTVEDLDESLRQQSIFDLRRVQYALVETNGHISAFCYPDQPEDKDLAVVVVSDGKPCDWGMRLCGLSEEALDRILRKKKCPIEDVFLLTVTAGGKPYLLTRGDVKGGGQ